MATTSAPRVGNVSGIPAVWVPCNGATSAGLVFRVGQLDEPLRRRGYTHLIEHLALNHLKNEDFSFNGFTGWLTTSFVMRGLHEEVGPFFAGVARALTSLPLNGAVHEAKILETEACQRGTSVATQMFRELFGATGPGVLAYPEFGLRCVDTIALDEWRAKHFTASNAYLWYAGPNAPEDFMHDLPSGSGHVPPSPACEPVEQTPIWANVQSSSVSIVALVADSPALGASLRIIERRLTERLRLTDGLTYSVSTSRVTADAKHDIALIFADHREGDAAKVRQAMLSELDRLCDEPATEEELTSWRTVTRRFFELEAESAASSRASQWAEASLVGARQWTDDVFLEAAAAVTVDDVTAIVRRIRDAAAWSMPFGSKIEDARIRRARSLAPWRARGELFTFLDESRDHQAIIVGDEGASLAWAHDAAVSVRFDSLVVAARSETGGVWLVDRSGFGISVEPAELVDGERALAAVLRRCDPLLVAEAEPSKPKEAIPPPKKPTWLQSRALANREREVSVSHQAARRWNNVEPRSGSQMTLNIGIPAPSRTMQKSSGISLNRDKTARFTVNGSSSVWFRYKAARVAPLFVCLGGLVLFLWWTSGFNRFALVPTACVAWAIGAIVTSPVKIVRNGPTHMTVRLDSVAAAVQMRKSHVMSLWAVQIPDSAPPTAPLRRAAETALKATVEKSGKAKPSLAMPYSPVATLARAPETAFTAWTAAAAAPTASELVASIAALTTDEQVLTLMSIAEVPDGRTQLHRVAAELGDCVLSFNLTGYAGIGAAWAARGTGWGSTVSASKGDEFLDHLREADRAFERASISDSHDVISRIGRVVTGRGLTIPIAERNQRFDECNRVTPDSFVAAAQHIQSIAPKWGGDIEEFVTFAADLIQLHGVAHPRACAALSAHAELALSESAHRVREFKAVRVSVIDAAESRLDAADLVSVVALNNAAGAAWLLGEKGISRTALQLLGNRLTAMPWSYRADGPRPLRTSLTPLRAIERLIANGKLKLRLVQGAIFVPVALMVLSIINGILQVSIHGFNSH
jgi:zinc protease